MNWRRLKNGINVKMDQSYRMNMIESIQKEIELEREKRTMLIDRYNILTIANSRVGKYLRTKMNKHENIRTLTESKLCNISGYISKALEDDVVSDEEYSMVLTEYNNYNVMKNEIRLQTKNALKLQQEKS